MTTITHQPVMDLIRASLDPASREATVRAESPACQVVTAEARADADEGDMMRVQLLAGGAAVAASLLTGLLAKERGVSESELIDELEAGRGPGAARVPLVLRSLAVDDGMRGIAELLAHLFLEDQGRFFDLIVELGEYVAGCVTMCSTLGLGTQEETLQDLDKALKDYVNA